ncbi:MAG: copper chaperone PCu(A)C [Pseudomonadota bacterium]
MSLKSLLPLGAIAVVAIAGVTVAGEMTHDSSKAGQKVAEHMVGSLTLAAPFARATLPNQPVAGAYLTITNTGSEDDALLSVSAPFAARGEVHEMAMDGDTMRMRQLPDGLVIPAGETVELKPGGYHLMFMQLNEPLIEGETAEATLEFRDAGKVTVPFTILGKGAKSMDHSGHGS